MRLSQRPLYWAVALVVGLLLAGAMIGRQWFLTPVSPAVEIGVLFPGGGASDASWGNFAAAVELAAEEMGLSFDQQENPREISVPIDPAGVVFRWYPEVGSRGIRRRVHQLCKQQKPPLALVGANNSSMTDALARELADCSHKQAVPLLLMTDSTADHLIDVNPGRSFRFGYNNSYQAKTVVDRLRTFYARRGVDDPEVRVVLVQVLDDPFTVDLAQKFRERLQDAFHVEIVPPDQAVRPVSGEKPREGAESASAWDLTTSTGGFDDPSSDEWKLARNLVAKVARDPGKHWVVVLPVGTTPFRRLSYALHESLDDFADRHEAQRAFDNLVILSGDSMNYYSFEESLVNQLLPEETPAPIIFFAHVNPIDPGISKTPSRHVPERGLDREVARALLAVLPLLGERPTPSELAQALNDYDPVGKGTPLFRDRERHEGGGAILAVPKPGQGRFELVLPEQWQPQK